MKILEVKYERAHSSYREKYQAEWEFTVTTDTEFPHGHDGFGGVLRRSEDGWQASHYSNTEWASPARSRQGAIANLLPIAFDAIARWKAAQASDEVEVVDHLRANPPHKIMRYQGGFWSAPVSLEMGRLVLGDGSCSGPFKTPRDLPWWCDIRTVRALEKQRVLRRTNEFVEEWRDTRELVPVTILEEESR